MKQPRRRFPDSCIIIFISTVFSIFSSGNSSAQSATRDCIRLLEDRSGTQVLSAIKAYSLLDTLHAEAAADALVKEAGNSSRRLQARVHALRARFLFYWLGPGDSLYASQMNEALKEAYVLNEPYMIAEFSRWYGEMLNTLGKKALAAQYCMNALKMQQELGLEHFYTPKTFYLTTAEMLYRTMNYPLAKQYYLAAFRLPDDSLSPKQFSEFATYHAQSLNALGRTYFHLKQYDSAVWYFRHCMRYVQQQQLAEDLFYIASDNRFDPLLELAQYDTCRVIADELYKAGLPDDSMTLLSACFMQGRIALRTGQPELALKWGQQAEQFGRGYKRQLYQVYKDLSAACKMLGREQQAMHYLEKWRELDEANIVIRQKAGSDFLEAESEFQAAKIKLVQLQQQHRQQVKKRNLLIGALALLVLLGSIYFIRRARVSAHLLREAQQQSHYFETHLRNASEELLLFKKEVEAKNQEIDTLRQKKETGAASKSDTAQIDNLSRLIILTEKDWEQFREAFDKVYPGFFTALRMKLPGITNAEIRMACLIKLNFDVKHIAGMLGISSDSVRKTRYRLKKRFVADTDEKLEDIIGGI